MGLFIGADGLVESVIYCTVERLYVHEVQPFCEAAVYYYSTCVHMMHKRYEHLAVPTPTRNCIVSSYTFSSCKVLYNLPCLEWILP